LLENGVTPEIFAQAMESIAEMFYVDVKRMNELEIEIDNLETENKEMADALEDIQETARRAIP
jgi:proteasome assembly chaperone (PAC2) family protein